MAVTPEDMQSWLKQIFNVEGQRQRRSLVDYLKAIRRVESLSDLPSGTPVLVRGDLDAKPGPNVGDGDVRLQSMKDTLDYGRQKGWKQVVFGHVGREPEKSLKKVAARLGEIIGAEVPLIEDWMDDGTSTIKGDVQRTIQNVAPGSVLMLENTRKYKIERVLWKAKPGDLPGLAPQLAKIANDYAEKIARVYVNEALSAGSLDTSTCVVPAAMDQVALGKYVAREFEGPMMRCLEASLVIFSGLKTDKLDDLQAMIDRGTVKKVITAGSLAMALKKAAAELEGKNFSLGVAEDPAHKDKPYYIERSRIDQAKQMIEEGRKKGIEFILPVDFILKDGRASETIGPQDQQFDVGPKTSELFAKKVSEFIEPAGRGRAVAFHNGVFGMFEDPRFEEGTRKFVAQLERMKNAGVEVYVGGGEGGAALDKYGKPTDVTHCFTAGGTVLNALGSEPVPYLVALAMAAEKKK